MTSLPSIGVNDYMFAMPGMRQANRNSPMSVNTATHAGVSLLRTSPAYPTKNYRVSFPNFYVQEGSSTEEAASNSYQVEAVALTVGGTTYSASLSTPVTVDPTSSDGGVMIEIPTGTIPAGSTINLRYALAFSANTAIPAYPRARSGEVVRGHDSTSFAAVVNSGASLGISGSYSTNWGGFIACPVFVTAQGTDGRPVVLGFGDSINYGKGQYDHIEAMSVIGMTAIGMNEHVNSLQWMYGDTSVAGSAPDSVVSSDTTTARRRALLALNGNTPFNLIVSEHGNNTDYTNLAAYKTLMKAYIAKLKGYYPGVPVVQTTMLVKATSTDGFRTPGNQVVNSVDGSSGNRFLWNDYLVSTLMDGAVDYVVNSWQGIAHDTTINRDHIKVAPFTATLTRAYSSGNTIYLSAAPSQNAALVMDPSSTNAQSMIATGITTITAGSEYQVTVGAGASSSSYPAKSVGTTVGEMYFADGQPQSSAVHMTARADDLIAQASWVPFKNSFLPGQAEALEAGTGDVALEDGTGFVALETATTNEALEDGTGNVAIENGTGSTQMETP